MLIVSLSCFGADAVRARGQPWFAQLAREAGADGVEVRGELLVDAERELDALGASGLVRAHSSPEGLWSRDGSLDLDALDRALAAARRLKAPRLKMSIGGYAAPAGFDALGARLAAAGIELLIENDQTAAAGSLPALQRVFGAADAAGLALGMTFDLGNWHWVGEDPLAAARALAGRVRYVHVKGVQRERARWVAVAPADSVAPWRALLRALPAALPWAIEYPLAGDDLLATTREQLALVRALQREPR
ncbi:MAG TPA: TIM barrel protein [Burkholderiaceae bacterium]